MAGVRALDEGGDITPPLMRYSVVLMESLLALCLDEDISVRRRAVKVLCRLCRVEQAILSICGLTGLAVSYMSQIVLSSSRRPFSREAVPHVAELLASLCVCARSLLAAFIRPAVELVVARLKEAVMDDQGCDKEGRCRVRVRPPSARALLCGAVDCNIPLPWIVQPTGDGSVPVAPADSHEPAETTRGGPGDIPDVVDALRFHSSDKGGASGAPLVDELSARGEDEDDWGLKDLAREATGDRTGFDCPPCSADSSSCSCSMERSLATYRGDSSASEQLPQECEEGCRRNADCACCCVGPNSGKRGHVQVLLEALEKLCSVADKQLLHEISEQVLPVLLVVLVRPLDDGQCVAAVSLLVALIRRTGHCNLAPEHLRILLRCFMKVLEPLLCQKDRKLKLEVMRAVGTLGAIAPEVFQSIRVSASPHLTPYGQSATDAAGRLRTVTELSGLSPLDDTGRGVGNTCLPQAERRHTDSHIEELKWSGLAHRDVHEAGEDREDVFWLSRHCLSVLMNVIDIPGLSHVHFVAFVSMARIVRFSLGSSNVATDCRASSSPTESLRHGRLRDTVSSDVMPARGSVRNGSSCVEALGVDMSDEATVSEAVAAVRPQFLRTASSLLTASGSSREHRLAILATLGQLSSLFKHTPGPESLGFLDVIFCLMDRCLAELREECRHHPHVRFRRPAGSAQHSLHPGASAPEKSAKRGRSRTPTNETRPRYSHACQGATAAGGAAAGHSAHAAKTVLEPTRIVVSPPAVSQGPASDQTQVNPGAVKALPRFSAALPDWSTPDAPTALSTRAWNPGDDPAQNTTPGEYRGRWSMPRRICGLLSSTSTDSTPTPFPDMDGQGITDTASAEAEAEPPTASVDDLNDFGAINDAWWPSETTSEVEKEVWVLLPLLEILLAKLPGRITDYSGRAAWQIQELVHTRRCCSNTALAERALQTLRRCGLILRPTVGHQVMFLAQLCTVPSISPSSFVVTSEAAEASLRMRGPRDDKEATRRRVDRQILSEPSGDASTTYSSCKCCCCSAAPLGLRLALLKTIDSLLSHCEFPLLLGGIMARLVGTLNCDDKEGAPIELRRQVLSIIETVRHLFPKEAGVYVRQMQKAVVDSGKPYLPDGSYTVKRRSSPVCPLPSASTHPDGGPLVETAEEAAAGGLSDQMVATRSTKTDSSALPAPRTSQLEALDRTASPTARQPGDQREASSELAVAPCTSRWSWVSRYQSSVAQPADVSEREARRNQTLQQQRVPAREQTGARGPEGGAQTKDEAQDRPQRSASWPVRILSETNFSTDQEGRMERRASRGGEGIDPSDWETRTGGLSEEEKDGAQCGDEKNTSDRSAAWSTRHQSGQAKAAGDEVPHPDTSETAHELWSNCDFTTKAEMRCWFRKVSLAMLKECRAPAVRACLPVALQDPSVAAALLPAVFLTHWASCCRQGDLQQMHQVGRGLRRLLVCPEVSLSSLRQMLNLVEMIERQRWPLPVDTQLLAAVAEKCQANAKAIRYREELWLADPGGSVEALIRLSNEMQQLEAARGILAHSQKKLRLPVKECWYVQLGEWEQALEAYEQREREDPSNAEWLKGKMRCLRALGEWERLAFLAADMWKDDFFDSSPMDFARSYPLRHGSDMPSLQLPSASASPRSSIFSASSQSMPSPAMTCSSIISAFQAPPSGGLYPFHRPSSEFAFRPLPSLLSLSSPAVATYSPLCPLHTQQEGEKDDTQAQDRRVQVMERRRETASLAASVAFHFRDWAALERYVQWFPNPDSYERAFYMAILGFERGEFQEALEYIQRARQLLDPELTALLGESYKRAYPALVTLQQLAELEEIVELLQRERRRREEGQHDPSSNYTSGSVSDAAIGHKSGLEAWKRFRGPCPVCRGMSPCECRCGQEDLGSGDGGQKSYPGGDNEGVEDERVGSEQLRHLWRTRLATCESDAETWQKLLRVRSLIVPPHEDATTWLRFSSLCRHQNRARLSVEIIQSLRDHPHSCHDPRVALEAFKVLHAVGRKMEAQLLLTSFCCQFITTYFNDVPEQLLCAHGSDVPLCVRALGLLEFHAVPQKARGLRAAGLQSLPGFSLASTGHTMSLPPLTPRSDKTRLRMSRRHSLETGTLRVARHREVYRNFLADVKATVCGYESLGDLLPPELVVTKLMEELHDRTAPGQGATTPRSPSKGAFKAFSRQPDIDPVWERLKRGERRLRRPAEDAPVICIGEAIRDSRPDILGDGSWHLCLHLCSQAVHGGLRQWNLGSAAGLTKEEGLRLLSFSHLKLAQWIKDTYNSGLGTPLLLHDVQMHAPRKNPRLLGRVPDRSPFFVSVDGASSNNALPLHHGPAHVHSAWACNADALFQILQWQRRAVLLQSRNSKAWSAWAVTNFQVAEALKNVPSSYLLPPARGNSSPADSPSLGGARGASRSGRTPTDAVLATEPRSGGGGSAWQGCPRGDLGDYDRDMCGQDCSPGGFDENGRRRFSRAQTMSHYGDSAVLLQQPPLLPHALRDLYHEWELFAPDAPSEDSGSIVDTEPDVACTASSQAAAHEDAGQRNGADGQADGCGGERVLPQGQGHEADPHETGGVQQIPQCSMDSDSCRPSRHEAEPLEEKAEIQILVSMLPHFIVEAVRAFLRSIELQPVATSLQDILRLLKLWFAHADIPVMCPLVQQGVSTVPLATWLDVIPQLVGRLSAPDSCLRGSLVTLLSKAATEFPQELILPVAVASKSTTPHLSSSACVLLNIMARDHRELVQQALLVSQEVVRVSALWEERWLRCLEQASEAHHTRNDYQKAVDILEPMHQELSRGPQTFRETLFLQKYGRELENARAYLERFRRSGNPHDVDQCWMFYLPVFSRLLKDSQNLKRLDLKEISAALAEVKDLQLAVPGTTGAGRKYPLIRSFLGEVSVFTSKQRPRKIGIVGSDGRVWRFLLKGQDDLTQDERIMQALCLINHLMESNAHVRRKELSIPLYCVVPLSPSAGLIGWLHNSETLLNLIKAFRQQDGIPVNHEQLVLKSFYQKYDSLTLLQKVDLFEQTSAETSAQALRRILWLQARNSEEWLVHRTNFCKSIAVISMVGYVLGLGDRHPSNLLLMSESGRVAHIDFSDCFEVATYRLRYPEKVPFRLTRMIVCALESGTVEGTFRATCEQVMTLLRLNRDAIVAMLEAAFVDDESTGRRLYHVFGKQHNPRNSPRTAGPSPAGSDPCWAGSRARRIYGEGASRGKDPSRKTESPRDFDAQGEPWDRQAASDSDGDLDANPSGVSTSRREKSGNDLASRFRRRSLQQLERPVSRSRRGSMDRLGYQATSPRRSDEAARASSVEETNLLKSYAKRAIARVDAKLTGYDFDGYLDIPAQVDRLIEEANGVENLCVAYAGWCPFW
ncbi:hypothetical protein BESB_078320 [Besnoitia besnoiti]|uniref:non-specific serine/threonine protein kinase n=1 Tax=Besnoitia besnoiti TaxID=94643 RepID=A0A2A9MCF4_BESBE|nr:hypothetical protein BESB_078320 [Besnoitia besnoiti]PFH33616.1 hypothetical protein BESB_078320 [Besnoitia besnoiti]